MRLAQSHLAGQRQSLGAHWLWAVLLLPVFRSTLQTQLLLTRGRRKPLRLLLGVQPKGSDSLSSYSAGSQRARAWLEAPSQGLLLQQSAARVRRSSGPRGVGWGREVPSGQVRPRHPPVVASPGDGSILVAALLLLVLDSTATGLGQQPQLGFCQHIWGWDRWAGSWVQGPGSFLTGAVPYLASLDPLPSQQPRLSALPSQVRAGPGARGGAQYQ